MPEWKAQGAEKTWSWSSSDSLTRGIGMATSEHQRKFIWNTTVETEFLGIYSKHSWVGRRQDPGGLVPSIILQSVQILNALESFEVYRLYRCWSRICGISLKIATASFHWISLEYAVVLRAGEALGAPNDMNLEPFFEGQIIVAQQKLGKVC